MKQNRRSKKRGLQTRPSRTLQVSGRRLFEILGIILLALTALIILSLLSYHADDPAFSAVSTDFHQVKNYAGRVGAYLADFLIQYLGWTATLVPLVSFYFALILFIPSRGKKWRRLARIGGVSIIILVLASVPATLDMKEDIIYGTQSLPGGFTGQIGARILMNLFSPLGSLVILIALFLFGLILSTGLSLQQIGCFMKAFWSWMRKATIEWVRNRFFRQPKPLVTKKPPYPKVERTPEIIDLKSDIHISHPKAPEKQTQFNFHSGGDFELPPLSLLNLPTPDSKKIARDILLMNSKILEKKLRDFGIEGQVTHVHPGPVITMYEYAPAPGVKVNRIVSLADDLALAMSAYSVRVIAPIPGKSVVGIEIPNSISELVSMFEILTSEEFKKSKSKLTFALGKDIVGNPVIGKLAKMPHLLIAGATGSGKSVMLNTLICSILFRATPAQVRFLLIDPKMVELTPYEGIPHLISPVVTNPKKASWALKNVVSIMEERYRILAEKDAKNIESYNFMLRSSLKNAEESEDFMPYLVIVIDELADLMMLASNDVEDSVTRLAQMSRAVGIHLVLATQRPSVNVITGVIKANLPARISFQVSSRNDSRIILDANGAEQLLGKGDMLFLPPGTSKLQRIHGAYISETEIKKVLDFIKSQAKPRYDDEILKPVAEKDSTVSEDEKDEKYDQAIELVRSTGQASISMIQRRLRVGYNRAARMVELMEQEGIISPPDGVKPRRILG